MHQITKTWVELRLCFMLLLYYLLRVDEVRLHLVDVSFAVVQGVHRPLLVVEKQISDQIVIVSFPCQTSERVLVIPSDQSPHRLEHVGGQHVDSVEVDARHMAVVVERRPKLHADLRLGPPTALRTDGVQSNFVPGEFFGRRNPDAVPVELAAEVRARSDGDLHGISVFQHSLRERDRIHGDCRSSRLLLVVLLRPGYDFIFDAPVVVVGSAEMRWQRPVAHTSSL